MKKRFLAVLTALCLTASLLPVTAFAGEEAGGVIYVGGSAGDDSADGLTPETAVSTLTTAVSKAAPGGIVRFAGDVEMTETAGEAGVVVEKSLTIEGGGHTLRASGMNQTSVLLVKGAQGVAVRGLNIESDGSAKYGIQAYCSSQVALQDVAVSGVQSYGLMVNASHVTASGRIDLTGNGFINVGYGTGISGDLGSGFDARDAQLVGVQAVWADAGDVERAGGKEKISILLNGFADISGEKAVWTFVPAQAEADGVGYLTLQQAVEQAAPGAEITLLADASVEETLVIAKPLTIDGAGRYAICGQAEDNSVRVEIVAGTVTFENVEFVDFGSQTRTTGRDAVLMIPEKDRLYQTLGQQPTEEEFAALSQARLVLDNVSIRRFCRTALDVRSGSFEVKNSDIDCTSVYTENDTLTKFLHAGLGAFAVTGRVENTTVKNAASTFEKWSASAIEVYNNANVTVSGGSIEGCETGIHVDNYWAGTSTYPSMSEDADIAVTVSGVSIAASGDAIRLYSREDQTRSGSVVINSGRFDGGISVYSKGADDSIVIRGGSFAQDPSQFVPEGYRVSETESGFEVSAPAVIVPPASEPEDTVKPSEPETSGGQTTVTTQVTPQVSGGTAKAEVDTSVMDETVSSALQAAGENGTAPVVEIALGETGSAGAVQVTLPASSMGTLGENAQAELTVSSAVGSVTLDSAAISAVAEQAQGETVTLTVAPVAPEDLTEQQKQAVGEALVFDLTLHSGGERISDFGGGKATASLPYTLDEQQDPAGVVVFYLDDEGGMHRCESRYDAERSMVVFETGHFSKYVVGYSEAAAWENPFADVLPDDWYYEAVCYAAQGGLMQGVAADRFAPRQAASRAMIVTILYRLEGSPAVQAGAVFSDVPSGQWYTDAVEWAAQNGIVEGVGGGRFAPDTAVTREQLAAILYRYAQHKGLDVTSSADLSGYSDAAAISGYAHDAMSWAVAQQIFSGVGGGVLNPGGAAERAQVAKVLMQLGGVLPAND